MDEIDEYIGETLDSVREGFWKAVETMVIPEMKDFMKNEYSAKKIIETTMEISVTLTLKEMTKNPARFFRLSQKVMKS